MNQKNRRVETRTNPTINFSPITCLMMSNGSKSILKIVNYHYRGACFKTEINDYRILDSETYLQFRIGHKDLPEKIRYRLVWESISENGMFGVEFTTDSSFVLSRAERFETHNINPPVVSSADPTDPNRTIYFKAVNISNTGMLLGTSLSNKHLFPGMELRNATLSIPGMGEVKLDLFIENSRAAGDNQTVLYGTSLKSSNNDYQKIIANYLSNLGSHKNTEERIEKLASENLLQKKLSRHLTIKEVTEAAEYEAVLKLRFEGYKLAGKVVNGKTHVDMGDGLDKEGVILGAYLGGQLIATCEFRLQHIHGLKISEKVNLSAFEKIRGDNLAEINRLVVHPKAQSTDIVLGIFQKIHALAMFNGRPDGLIFADDKLVPLYERLGFQKVGYSTPHPTKQGLNLNLMLIRSEAYASSEGMNPYAWSVAFEESHEFFSGVGIQERNAFSIQQKVSKNVTKFLYTNFGNRRKKKKVRTNEVVSENANQNLESKSSRNISDPKWTVQHVNATIILPYIYESFELIGKDKTLQILLEFGFDTDYFKKVSNWVSIDFFNEFVNEFAKQGDPYLLNKGAGYRSTSKEVLGINYFIMKHFFSPQIAFKTFEKFLPKFNKTRIYKVIESGSSFCRIRITNPDPELVPTHPATKENWLALIDAYVQILTKKPAKIDLIKSTFDGDLYCEYYVTWTNPLFSTKKLVPIVGSIALFGYVTSVGLSRFSTTEVVIGLALFSGLSALGFSIFKWLTFSTKYSEMVESLSNFEKQADEKYRELQSSKTILEKSYQEGQLLESIHREIQKSEDLTNILEVALERACSKFNFRRAFVMIIDDDSRFLRTAAVYGLDGDHAAIWQFKVDVNVRRDNPLVLSSVYHTGQSIILNDLDDHKFHLNESSRVLIESLKTKGFTMIPIPSEKKNWGVLVADKGQNGDVITRRDMVALQRVSQSLGLALDKKAKIDSEKKIRKIFQKYVPSTVIENTLGQNEPRLGGESKEVICVFMDIRNFTSLSTKLPPQILVNILNDIYSVLHTVVVKNNGLIDKFLGDGALITWGAVPGSVPDPKMAIDTTIQFLEELDKVNIKLKNVGLPKIEVGFGVHKGLVVAGNIGSDERMEYTVIGSTVNLASRLEQLTKLFKAQVVISEAVLPFENLGPEWSVKEGVSVRGVEENMNVACLTLNIEEEEERKVESA